MYGPDCSRDSRWWTSRHTTAKDDSDNAASSSDTDSKDAPDSNESVDSIGTNGEGNPTDKNSEQVPSPNITDQQKPAGETLQSINRHPGDPNEPQPDPVSGLITDEYGNLIDPETGGIVDPETGAIRDAETGQFVGLADQYLNNVVCAVS